MSCQFTQRVPEIRRNLLRLYRARTESDDTLGRAWYPAAHRIVLDWADTYGVSIATVACVIAAISPQIDWPRNLIAADDVLGERSISVGGPLLTNVGKARRILNDRAHQTLPYFPHGPKVASFACNLAGDWSVATIDGHAMQAGLDDVQANYHLRWAPYAIFAECYRHVARDVGLEPAVFQSIIWHAWKRLHPRTSKIQERRQWHVIGELEGED